MKNLLLFTFLFTQISLFTNAQDSTQSKYIKEWSIITSNFKSFDLGFKVGGKSNWFLRAKTANFVFNNDSIIIPDTTIEVLNRGIGGNVGLEKRFYVNPHLSWALGIDAFTHYNITKDDIGNDRDNNDISSYKKKFFRYGIAIPLSFNYQFADHRVMFSFEIAPTYSKTIQQNEYYFANSIRVEETERFASTGFQFIDSSTIHFALAYRFYK